VPARDRQEARHRGCRSVSRAPGCSLWGRARQEDSVRGSVRVESIRPPGFDRRTEADVPRDPVASTTVRSLALLSLRLTAGARPRGPAGAAQATQPPPPRFRTGVDVVEV